MQDFITTEYNAILQTLQQNLAETTGVDSTLESFISPLTPAQAAAAAQIAKLPTKEEVAEKEKKFIQQLSKILGRPPTDADIKKRLEEFMELLNRPSAVFPDAPKEQVKTLEEVMAKLGFGPLVKTQ